MATTENNVKKTVDFTDDYPTFQPEMKHTHTILIPDMLPYHFEVLKYILMQEGYKIEVLHNDSRAVIDEGLKHVHNDTCFPALCVIGQYIDALKSGKYDVDHTAVLISQTGGGCRASNYLPLIRKALKAEFPQVPVLSINFSGLEKGNGIPMTVPLLLKMAYGIFYGDNIMTLYNQTLPYELEAGAAQKARQEAIQLVYDAYDNNTYKKYKQITKQTLEIFKKVKRSQEQKVKVGVVGEIYVKYSPLGNSHLEDFLHAEGWLIPAEMAALAETGTDNIVCAQPFGCLPNHIAGKGVARTLKNMYVNENIVPVDYDPSATRVNQENRIKLMLATARENLKNKQK